MDVKAFNRKRIILGIAFAPAFFCLITYPWRVHVFGEYQYKVMLTCFVLAALVMHLYGPTLDEVREYHDQRIKADREAYEAETNGSCMSGKMSGHNPAMPKKYQNQHVRVYGVLVSWAELYDRLKRFGENSGVENYCASADIALITRLELIAPKCSCTPHAR